MKYTNSHGISIEVTPFFDNGCALNYIQLYECIGGDLARGTMELMIDVEQGKDLIQDQYTGHITLSKEEGNVYEIDFFIVAREYRDNRLRLEFRCVKDKDFFTIPKTTSWVDVDKAISSLYPGNVDVRCESDVNNQTEFIQYRETDHQLLSRLCSSFKYNTIFGFGWEGLVLKETIGKDHNGNDEPYYVVYGSQQVFPLDKFKFVYNRELYEDPINPWEELDTEDEYLPDRVSLESRNCSCIRRYDSYSIVGKEHYQAIKNREYNLRYLDTSIFTSFRVLNLDLPMWKLGDVIIYKDRKNTETDFPFDTFLVKSNEIFLAPDNLEYSDSMGYKFSCITKLIGLKQSGVDLNTTDPTNNNEG